ncbi:MFS transporter [Ramlibacter humi]|uniref:MFS transporter n=1 Tax=Ramlibacter humi TaxID=2530451 RepID=A0A4Z0BCQ3_9BURK|nr:MFS transporter [Ramlibacter humi]TFY97012.1 MFS transporter [Ramlibacter humi]
MSCPAATLPAAPAVAVPSPSRAGAQRRHFYLLASVTLSFLAGSSAPTPLYPVYQVMWGFTPVTVAAIFATYAVVLLAALLVLGRLSDHVGRRPVIVAAALAQAVAMAVFASAQDTGTLFIARVVQGLATGAAIAAIGAAMLDLDRQRGTLANAVAPALGTASGAVLSGVLVHWLPQPTHLVYWVLGTAYLLQAAGVWAMPEPGRRVAGALASLRPRFDASPQARAALRIAAPAVLAGWSLAGFAASLGPALVRRDLSLDASLGGGIALFVLAGSAGVTVLALRRAHERTLLAFGATALLTGMGAMLFALQVHSPAAYIGASMLAGAGFGASFQGGVRSVLAAASAADRAGALSVLFVLSYLAMGLPAVAAGAIVALTGNLHATSIGFGLAIMALAALARLGLRDGVQAERLPIA